MVLRNRRGDRMTITFRPHRVPVFPGMFGDRDRTGFWGFVDLRTRKRTLMPTPLIGGKEFKPTSFHYEPYTRQPDDLLTDSEEDEPQPKRQRAPTPEPPIPLVEHSSSDES